MEYEILQEAKEKNFSVHLEKRKNNKYITKNVSIQLNW